MHKVLKKEIRFLKQ